MAVYGITVRQDDWQFVIEVSLSGNRRKLWLSVPLSMLPRPRDYLSPR